MFGSWFLPKIWANLPVPTAGRPAVPHQGMVEGDFMVEGEDRPAETWKVPVKPVFTAKGTMHLGVENMTS